MTDIGEFEIFGSAQQKERELPPAWLAQTADAQTEQPQRMLAQTPWPHTQFLRTASMRLKNSPTEHSKQVVELFRAPGASGFIRANRSR